MDKWMGPAILYVADYTLHLPPCRKPHILLFLGLFSVMDVGIPPCVPVRSLRIVLDPGISHIDEIQLFPSHGSLLASQ